MQEVYFGFLDPTTSKGLYAVITDCAREANKDIYLLHNYQLSPTLIFEGKTKQYFDGFPKKRENQDQSKNAKSVSTL